MDVPGQGVAGTASARAAGLLYLVVAIFGGFAQIVRVNVYEPGDAAATAANIVSNATLVRLSFVADLIQALVWLVLAVTLYRLLAHAGRNIARAMVVFVAVSAAITSLNMVNQLGALLVATNHSYATALGVDGSHALVLLLMDLQHYGYLIAQLAWLWLFALGLLGYRSGMFPRWLSFLLMLGTVCYVIDALTRFLVPVLRGHLGGHLRRCRRSSARWRCWPTCSSRGSGRLTRRHWHQPEPAARHGSAGPPPMATSGSPLHNGPGERGGVRAGPELGGGAGAGAVPAPGGGDPRAALG